MEIPYEIKLILDSDYLNENDFIILEPSLFNYFTENEKYALNKLINELVNYPIKSVIYLYQYYHSIHLLILIQIKKN